MAFIVEDGTIVAGANTYVTVAEFQEFCSDRGFEIPTDTTTLEQMLIKGTDETETYRTQLQGEKVSSSQSLQFPRYDVYVDGFPVASDEIPQTLKNAEMQFAYDGYVSGTYYTNQTAGNIKKEKVDVIEITYQDGNGSQEQPYFPRGQSYMDPLLKSNGGVFLVNPIR